MPKAINAFTLPAAFLLALLTVLPLHGQAPTKPRFEHLTADQGLSGIYLKGLTQDNKGFIWVGTQYGLHRYDGYGFKDYQFDPVDSTIIRSIQCMLVDHEGDLWIGTRGSGLKYFDTETEKFIHYRHDENDPNSLSSNDIWAIYEDAKGTIWIGADYTGLNKLDREKKQFINYHPYPEDLPSYSNRVRAIFEDSKKNLWIGTPVGLKLFDRKREIFSDILKEGDTIRLPQINGYVSCIFEDEDGNRWISTNNGLFLFDGHSFLPFKHDPNDPASISNSRIMSICQDGRNGLWLGSRGGGLEFLDIKNRAFTNYKNDPSDPNSLHSNFIESLFSDRENNLWIGTTLSLDRLNVSYQPFTIYTYDPYLEKKHDNLSNNVSCYLEDAQGFIWFRPQLGGLIRLDPNTGQFTHFLHDPNDPSSLFDNFFSRLIVDKNGNLWLGSFNGKGLCFFNRKTEKFTNYRPVLGDSGSLTNPYIRNIYEDRSGHIWIGTGDGLNRFNPDQQNFDHFMILPDLGGENQIFSIIEDASGYIWFVVVDKGIRRLNPQTGDITHYHHNPADPNTISSNNVFHMVLDKEGNLLLPTDIGLDQLILQPGQEPPFKVNRQLVSDAVHSILVDNKDNIWLGTLQGLLKYDPKTKNIRKYEKHDGLPDNGFGAIAYKSPYTGKLYFDNYGGLLTFHPDSLPDNPFIPPIAFTALYYYDGKEGSGKPIGYKNITYRETISLQYYQNTLAIEFSALSYNKTAKNQYAYMIEGVNDNWIQLGTERKLNLTNLKPGTYSLRVKGSNGDGVWNEEGTRLKIIILPPWWLTWWAKTAYAIALILLVIGFIRTRTRALRKRQKELEQTVAERTVEVREKNVKLEETLNHLQTTQQQLIMQEKMASLGQMTAGIAHEIKNPLNFINNFAEGSVELADELKEEIERLQASHDPKDQQLLLELLGDIRENAVLIHDNGQRADNIVSSMMDHANDNQGERTPTDLNTLLEEYINLAYHGYQTKNTNVEIDFIKQLDASIPKLLINSQEMGRVFINLFNNAIYAVDQKAQTEKGDYNPSILVSTRQVNEQVEIRIRDNGSGIPESIRDKIFNPFFTTKPTGKGNTGLGLSISYDIVVQGHQGKLAVESEGGSFTEFVILLPVYS